MESLRNQLEKELRVLSKIALFDPRFTNTYGKSGRFILSLISLSIFALALYPVVSDISNANIKDILYTIFTILLLAFGAVLVGSWIGEFFIKGFNVISMCLKNELTLPLEIRIVGFLSPVLSVSCVAVHYFAKDGDIWVYPVFAATVLCSYGFVVSSWTNWYETKVQQTASDNSKIPPS